MWTFFQDFLTNPFNYNISKKIVSKFQMYYKLLKFSLENFELFYQK